MRYAIINTFNNVWEYEGDNLEDIKEMAESLKAGSVELAIVGPSLKAGLASKPFRFLTNRSTSS